MLCSKDANSQAARLLRGPLCLLGPRAARLVHDRPLARESRGPREDPEAPPSRAPRGAPPALELPRGTERKREGRGGGGLGRPGAAVCASGVLPGLTAPRFPVGYSDIHSPEEDRPHLQTIPSEALFKAEINLNFKRLTALTQQ